MNVCDKICVYYIIIIFKNMQNCFTAYSLLLTDLQRIQL